MIKMHLIDQPNTRSLGITVRGYFAALFVILTLLAIPIGLIVILRLVLGV